MKPYNLHDNTSQVVSKGVWICKCTVTIKEKKTTNALWSVRLSCRKESRGSTATEPTKSSLYFQRLGYRMDMSVPVWLWHKCTSIVLLQPTSLTEKSDVLRLISYSIILFGGSVGRRVVWKEMCTLILFHYDLLSFNKGDSKEQQLLVLIKCLFCVSFNPFISSSS